MPSSPATCGSLGGGALQASTQQFCAWLAQSAGPCKLLSRSHAERHSQIRRLLCVVRAPAAGAAATAAEPRRSVAALESQPGRAADLHCTAGREQRPGDEGLANRARACRLVRCAAGRSSRSVPHTAASPSRRRRVPLLLPPHAGLVLPAASQAPPSRVSRRQPTAPLLLQAAVAFAAEQAASWEGGFCRPAATQH